LISILEIKDLLKYFGKTKAVDVISFSSAVRGDLPLQCGSCQCDFSTRVAKVLMTCSLTYTCLWCFCVWLNKCFSYSLMWHGICFSMVSVWSRRALLPLLAISTTIVRPLGDDLSAG